MSIINAIISAIMSFLMLLFPWIKPAEPVGRVDIDLSTVEVVDVDDFMGYEDTFLFTTYNRWKSYAVGAYCDIYDSKFFNDHSLAVIEISNFTGGIFAPKVNSAYEENGKLVVDYEIAMNGENVKIGIECKAVLIPVSKNVTEVSANLTADARETFTELSELSGVTICDWLASDVTLGEYAPQIISSYEDWKSFPGGYSLYNVGKKCTREFFENNSLVAIEVVDTYNKFVNVNSFVEDGNVLKVDYSVHKSIFEITDIYGMDVVLIPVSKNITSVEATLSKDERVAQQIDLESIKIVTKWGSPTMDYDYGTESSYMLVSNYSSWKSCARGKNDTVYDEAFFEENSLVLIGAMLPSPAASVEVSEAFESTLGTLWLTYNIVEGDGVSMTLVCYSDIIVPVSKDVQDVRIVISK